MEKMDMHSRSEYLKVLTEKYLKVKVRKEKTEILDEYCRNTGQSRKYAIRKIHSGVGSQAKLGKRRKQVYDGQVSQALSRIWEIFDCPCGQRLKPILETEVDRLMESGELLISDEVALKLKKVSSATIDRKLKHQREVLHLLRSRHTPRPGSLLGSQIPIRLTQWDTSKVGYIEMDLVCHCGSSTLGEYINTLSTTEIASGWWEGEAIMGKSQDYTFRALKKVRERTPFEWKGLDSDNGPEFINSMLYKYCSREKLEFTRSRPLRKNDNAYIEQKNWTHVRKVLGYLRYDSYQELVLINDLYHNELRLYKNFFQPVMKLKSKERAGGKVKRQYDTPKTPYQRLMGSGQISAEAKRQLETTYLNLNPAQLKRSIDAKLEKLYQICKKKGKSGQVDPSRKVVPHMVTNYMIEQSPVGLPG
jgi:hypothetical protein